MRGVAENPGIEPDYEAILEHLESLILNRHRRGSKPVTRRLFQRQRGFLH